MWKNRLMGLMAVASALAAGTAPGDGALRAGAATSNVTPHLGTSLDGVISQNGDALHVHDELNVRCLVLDDGETRLAMAVVDSTMVARPVLDRAKALIEERSGLPPDRVLISATHSHATPRVLPGLTTNPLNLSYEEFLARRIADGVERAVRNLAPAKVGWSSFDKPEYVHNRRWFLEPGTVPANPFGETGEQVKMNPGRKDLVKPAGPVDPEVFLLSVQHADGRPLAILGNYGTHYVGGYQRGHVSSDYFGLFAEQVARLLGAEDQQPPFVAIMSNGTSGDVNPHDFSKPARKFAQWTRMRNVAFDLAGEVRDRYESIEHRADLTLGMAQAELEFAVRKPDAARLAWARETVVANPAPGQRLSRPQVYAREALALADYPERIGIILQAIRIGDLGIATSPCETFAETGLAIKERSPFEETFTIELANGADGYLPTPEQHRWGGYETWPARSSCLEVGAEPKIRATLLDLLRRVTAGR